MIQAIQKNVTWKAIPIAGLAGGTLFLLAVLLLTPALLEVDSVVSLRYFAGLVMGRDAVSDPSSSVLIVGVLVHYVLSMLFALVVAVVVHRWGLLVGIIGGAVMGLCLYAINLYTLTYFFEWFFAINSSVLLLAHVLYGAVVGGVYEMFDHFDLPLMKEATR
jgi:hypothetical protein